MTAKRIEQEIAEIESRARRRTYSDIPIDSILNLIQAYKNLYSDMIESKDDA